MDDQAWAGVEALHRPLSQALRSAFPRPALLSIALDTEETAAEVVAEALGGSAPSAESKRLGTALFAWAAKHRRLEVKLLMLS